MVNVRCILLSLMLLCFGASDSRAIADDRTPEVPPNFKIPVMAVASAKALDPDVSLPLISKDYWRFILTLSRTPDPLQLSGKGIYPRLPTALELNSDAASGAILHSVSFGADVDFRIHQHARVRMTYIRLNAHDNYIDAFRQSFSTDPQNSEKGSECAVVQLRIQF